MRYFLNSYLLYVPVVCHVFCAVNVPLFLHFDGGVHERGSVDVAGGQSAEGIILKKWNE